MSNIRPAAVAGYFYPADPEILAADVRSLLSEASVQILSSQPKALIVPHAGYVYSGPTAACAYRQLEMWAKSISRVILLGPTHRTPLRGLALTDADFFSTPLGNIPIDQTFCHRLLAMPQVHLIPACHVAEHSLEVQLPFLQTVLDEFQLVPLAVGLSSQQEVAEVLDRCRDGDDTLIIISSDLSHYLSYEQATERDHSTLCHILAADNQLSEHDACGVVAIRGLLHLAHDLKWKAELLDYRNSGDTAGDKNRVVGYAAIAFTEGI